MTTDKNYLDPRAILNPGPCGPGRSGDMCFSDGAISKLRKHAADNSDKQMSEEINRVLANPTHDNQYNLLHNPETVKALNDEGFIDELITGFKVPAPQGNKLFNNFNENLILKQLHVAVPSFANFDCMLMDFYKDPNNSLTLAANENSQFISNIRSGDILSFGTIPNTLVSSGDITRVGHWVALFGDFRGDTWTIEYYNSTGNNAPKGMYDWMQNLAKIIKDNCGHNCIALNVSNVASQKGPTECGIYSLHYIICRLIGIDYKEFRANKIPDNEVNKIRKIFTDEAKIPRHIKMLLRSKNLM